MASPSSSTDPARWQTVKALFEDAVARPPGARAAFLAEACADDPALRREVEALLTADAEADSAETAFLDDTPFADSSAPLLDALADQLLSDRLPGEDALGVGPGDEIGAYRVLRRIGEGGMGEVLLAERADGAFDHRVALKLVKPGMDSRAVLRRFRAERRILARLDHPGIARLLAGGATHDGRPYFAMEYIEGEPITTYCGAQGLRLDARLDLFAQVCEAVRHAHARLVVHRDLKPSNVLVAEDETGRPQVKLLDFGIARLLEEDRADDAPRSLLTAPGVRPMTRAYAAPEQIRGEAATTATDVYALGVLLYELLTGQRPFTADAPAELERAILMREPARPSAVVRDAPEQRERPSADLDTICLKALGKEPEARYASTHALLEDVQRYRAGQPIAARRPTASYRLRKFVGRHTASVVAATAVVLVLLGGIGLYTVRVTAERDRAQTAADRAEAASSFLADLFEGADPTVAQGDTLTAFDLLARGAERIEAELAGQHALQADLYLVISKAYLNLGRADEAERFARRALTLRQRDGGAAQARAEVRLAQALAAGDQYPVADSLLQAAERRARASGHVPTLIATLEALGRLGFTHSASPDAIQAPLEEAVTLRRQHGSDDAGLGAALYDLALAQHLTGDFERAETLFREAVAAQRQAQSEPAVLASTLADLGELLHYRRQYAEAQPLLEEALMLREQVYGPEHPTVAAAHGVLGINAVGLDWPADAERHITTAMRLYERLNGRRSRGYLDALMKWRTFLTEFDRAAEALPVMEEVMSLTEALHGRESQLYASTVHGQALTLYQNARYREAEPVFRQALVLQARVFGESSSMLTITNLNAGQNAEMLGALDLAEQYYEAAWSIAQTRLPADNARRAEVAYRLGMLLHRQSRHAEALAPLRAATEASPALNAFGRTRNGTHARYHLGAALVALERYEEAEPHLRAAHEDFLQSLGADHERTTTAALALADCLRAMGRTAEVDRLG